jgi:hypothetical protein
MLPHCGQGKIYSVSGARHESISFKCVSSFALKSTTRVIGKFWCQFEGGQSTLVPLREEFLKFGDGLRVRGRVF